MGSPYQPVGYSTTFNSLRAILGSYIYLTSYREPKAADRFVAMPAPPPAELKTAAAVGARFGKLPSEV